jgi:hypothetical protein
MVENKENHIYSFDFKIFFPVQIHLLRNIQYCIAKIYFSCAQYKNRSHFEPIFNFRDKILLV